MTTTQIETVITGPKIVKRYKNRKLYDTEESKYLTLRDLVGFVTSGRDVQVIDNLTKSDITGQTFLQALVETEQDAAGQTTVLRDILKAGGLAKYIVKVTGPVVG